jgi:hypothetical protein
MHMLKATRRNNEQRIYLTSKQKFSIYGPLSLFVIYLFGCWNFGEINPILHIRSGIGFIILISI